MLHRTLLLLLLSQLVRHHAGSAYSINVHYDSAVSVNGEVKVSPVFGITQVPSSTVQHAYCVTDIVQWIEDSL